MEQSTKDAIRSLRSFIHPKDILHLLPTEEGKPSGHKNIKRVNTRAHINQSGRENVWLDTWTNKKFVEHRDRDETYFYTSQAHRGLICLDIDCHKLGDITEALAVASELKREFFPGLHAEPSTSGSGAHAYLVMEWDWLGSAKDTTLSVRKQLAAFGRWLTDYAKNRGYEFDVIEIKGTPSFDTWTAKGLPDVDFGQACKLPRNLEAIETTSRVHLSDVMTLVDDNQDESRQQDSVRRERVAANPSGRIELNASTGNDSLMLSRQDVIDRHDEAMAIMRHMTFSVNGKKSLSVKCEDVSLFLAMLHAFSESANDDGSMPTERFRKTWNLCRQHGVTDRGFNASRFAAIRNAFVDAELINMKDNRYSFHPKTVNGKKVDGFAMRWALDSVQVDILVSLEDSLSSPLIPTASNSPQEKQLRRRLSTTCDRGEGRGGFVLRNRRPRYCPIELLTRERVPILSTAA
ncbi:hypothetical protein [Aporhodopirellula aestuarii]|uniref:Primase C-terminal 1 domain-containing protein n=1 Tax=Aporhodopirellula aestuarii TaxID=2950107 RepID=A0ABT0TYI1_9BACT|nr:hypothetical protein [Aporhodopirellula aestuarii]MCM2369657.1 hypothetical protein [Aporhodopirellula aestuarii]